MQYHAHGLTVASNRPIPALMETGASSAPDIRIWFGERPPASDVAHESIWFHSPYRTPHGQPVVTATRRQDNLLQLAFADGPRFVLDAQGENVWITWPPAQTEADTLSYLLGPVLGVMLRLRGRTCLHASGVDVGGVACAFVGAEGSGKSTLAAAFARASCPILSDDIVTLVRAEATWCVAPGYPRIRLWPDTRAALGFPADRVVSPGDNASLSRYHLDVGAAGVFARERVPLAVIYQIDFDRRAVRPRIDAVAPGDALPWLAAHTFASRVLDRDRRAQEFDALADLLKTVPVRRLRRVRDLSDLTRVCDTVLGDVSPGRRG